MDSTKTTPLNNKTVGFQMSCYEKTWRDVIYKKIDENLSYLSRFGDIFSEKLLIINNVNSYTVVRTEFLKKYKGEDISAWDTGNESQNEIILNKFGLYLKEIQPKNYSIQHFYGIYLTDCDYIFHVSEDCDISKLDDNFIIECIEEMESNYNIIVAFPRWCPDVDSNFEEVLPKTKKFRYQFGFTDQVYLIKTKEFKKDIYHYTHPMSERYPWYGGECFEKRVDAYMRKENMYGIVHREYEYKHG